MTSEKMIKIISILGSMKRTSVQERRDVEYRIPTSQSDEKYRTTVDHCTCKWFQEQGSSCTHMITVMITILMHKLKPEEWDALAQLAHTAAEGKLET